MFHVEQFRPPQLCSSLEQLEAEDSSNGCGDTDHGACSSGGIGDGISSGSRCAAAGDDHSGDSNGVGPDSDATRAGGFAAALTPPDEAMAAFQQYYNLLSRWNSTYNLTSINNPLDFAELHIRDSLAAVSLLPPGASVCDVGAGAGFPGLPLRILRPDISLVLIESRGKKIQFLKECIRLLKLDNIQAIQTRMEDFSPPAPFDRIVSRATFSSDNWILSVQHWLSHQGAFLIWRSAGAQKSGFSGASKSALNREPAPQSEIFEKLNWSAGHHYYKIGPLAYRVIEEWRPLKNTVAGQAPLDSNERRFQGLRSS